MSKRYEKYELVKDLPDADAGTILEWDGDDHYDYKSKRCFDDDTTLSWYRKEFVENNPSWFKPIEDKEPTAFQLTLDELIKEFKYLEAKSLNETTQVLCNRAWRLLQDFQKPQPTSIPAGKGTANDVLNEKYWDGNGRGKEFGTAFERLAFWATHGGWAYCQGGKRCGNEPIIKLSHLEHMIDVIQKETGTANETINEGDIVNGGKWVSEKPTQWASTKPNEEKKDWEIVALKNFAGGIFKKNNGKWRHVAGGQDVTASFTDEQIIKENGKTLFIHSVRRLSDNEVFSVGDEVETKFWRKQKITGFEIMNDNMIVDFATCKNPLENITHSTPTANDVQNERDWEIVQFKGIKNPDYTWTLNEDGKTYSHNTGSKNFSMERLMGYVGDTAAHSVINGQIRIEKVRRKSDNEVFSVGDVFSDNTAGFYTEQKIKSFEIYGKDMKLIMNDKGAFYRLGSHVKKVPSKSTANDVSKEEPMVFKCMLCGDKKYVGNPVLDRQFKSIDDYIKVEKEKADRQDKKEREGLSEPWLGYKELWSRKRLLDLIEFTRAASSAYGIVNIYDQFIATDSHKEPERWDLMWSEGKIVLHKSPHGKWLLVEYPDKEERK